MNKLCSLLLITFGFLFYSNAFADGKDPGSIARDYFEAIENEGMGASVRFIHPDAMAEFKSMLLPVYEAEAELGTRQLIDITFGSTAEVGSLKTLEPVEFMGAFMNLITAQMGTSKVHFDKMEILGTINENEDKHVLTRLTVGFEELAITQFEVLSFKPYKNTWRLQLNGQMKGFANQLRASLPPPS